MTILAAVMEAHAASGASVVTVAPEHILPSLTHFEPIGEGRIHLLDLIVRGRVPERIPGGLLRVARVRYDVTGNVLPTEASSLRWEFPARELILFRTGVERAGVLSAVKTRPLDYEHLLNPRYAPIPSWSLDDPWKGPQVGPFFYLTDKQKRYYYDLLKTSPGTDEIRWHPCERFQQREDICRTEVRPAVVRAYEECVAKSDDIDECNRQKRAAYDKFWTTREISRRVGLLIPDFALEITAVKVQRPCAEHLPWRAIALQDTDGTANRSPVEKEFYRLLLEERISPDERWRYVAFPRALDRRRLPPILMHSFLRTTDLQQIIDPLYAQVLDALDVGRAARQKQRGGPAGQSWKGYADAPRPETRILAPVAERWARQYGSQGSPQGSNRATEDGADYFIFGRLSGPEPVTDVTLSFGGLGDRPLKQLVFPSGDFVVFAPCVNAEALARTPLRAYLQSAVDMPLIRFGFDLREDVPQLAHRCGAHPERWVGQRCVFEIADGDQFFEEGFYKVLEKIDLKLRVRARPIQTLERRRSQTLGIRFLQMSRRDSTGWEKTYDDFFRAVERGTYFGPGHDNYNGFDYKRTPY